MISFQRQGIRWRMAMLYLGVFAVSLIIFCALLFQYFQRVQAQVFDTTLYNFTVDISSNLEMDFVGRLFVVNSTANEAGKLFPFHLGGSYLEIRDTSGRILLHSRSLGESNLPLDSHTLDRISHDKAIFQTISSSHLKLGQGYDDLRMLTFWAHHSDWHEPLILQVAVPLELTRKERRELILFFMLAVPSLLLVVGLAGIWMSRYALIPVRQMTLRARNITGVEKLKLRIPVPKANDEIRELAETFNGLLDRLELAFASQDRFISNASHQLKTPLTILKGELDQLKRAKLSGEDLTTALGSASSEIDRLIKLVQDLLLLARLEVGHDTIALTRTRLDEVLMKAVSRLQKLARTKNVQINTHFASDEPGCELDVDVMGDEDLLDSMLENFIENAVKYSPENSVVEVEMRTERERVRVVIKDRGPGVPAELREKVFERFSRVEPSNVIPGSGLGLSIAAEIARIHQVGVELNDRSDGASGTSVVLTFPLPVNSTAQTLT